MNQEQQSHGNSAKFAFFYLLSLVALLAMSLSTGMIIFQIINKNFVDTIDSFRGQYSTDVMKYAISAIIISTPIFYIITSQIIKSLFKGTLDKDSGVRKWLSYFILLISSVVMIGWLIATIYNFLDGELTLKFGLKALTAILISGLVFSYYFYDVRREKVVEEKDRVIKIYFYGTLAVVIATLISSFFFVDSPKKTRDLKYDSTILNQFSQIDNAMQTYYAENKGLPGNLNKLLEATPYLIPENLENKETGEKYEYKITGDKTYELCATFRTSNKDLNDASQVYYQGEWEHDAGYQCLKHNVLNIGIIKEPMMVR